MQAQSRDPQPESGSCDQLLESLLYIADQENIHASYASLKAGRPLVDGKLTPALYVEAAQELGISSKIVQRSWADLHESVLPATILMQGNKALVLIAIKNNVCDVFDPVKRKIREINAAEIDAEYTGFAIFSKVDEKLDERADALNNLNVNKKHWFWGTFFDSWRLYRDVLVASLFINVFVLANPLFVMNVYDRVVPNNAIETLWALAIGIIVLYCFDFSLKVMRTYFLEIAGKKSDVLISAFLLKKVMGVKLESSSSSVGALLSFFREFETLRNFIASSTIISLIDLPFALLFLLVVAYIGGALMWVPLSLIPLVLFYSWCVHKRLQNVVAHSFGLSAQKNVTLVEALTNIEVLKTLNAEGRIQSRWENLVSQLAKWGLKSRCLSSSATAFAGFIQQLSSVLIVIVGVYLIAEREITQGALIACVILGGRILAPFTQVSGLLVQYYQSKLAFSALDELTLKPQEAEPEQKFIQDPKLKGELEFKQLSFTYPNESQPALRDFNLKVRAGEKLAIIGKIGSGKSTLQKLLVGLYSAQAGNVLIDDVDIAQYHPADIRHQTAYVAQDSGLFYGTLRENIMFGAKGFDDAELIRVANIAGISSWVNAHPEGFERNIGEGGKILSGGQRQEVAIARALVGKPNIMLFDEPTASMDNASEAQFTQAMTKELSGKTLILVTHKISLLSLVDRVVVIDSGRIVADGEKQAVLEALKKGQFNVAR